MLALPPKTSMATAICCAVQRGGSTGGTSTTGGSSVTGGSPGGTGTDDAFDGEEDRVPDDRNASTAATTTIAAKAPRTTQVSRTRIVHRSVRARQAQRFPPPPARKPSRSITAI